MASKISINNTEMSGRDALEYAILENMKDKSVDEINDIIGTAKAYITANSDELAQGIRADTGIKEIGNTGYYYRFWHDNKTQVRLISALGFEARVIDDYNDYNDDNDDVNNIIKRSDSRHIPSNVAAAIDAEAQSSEFVGKYAGDLNRYDKHHLIPYSQRSFFVEADIHSKDNLIAVNKFYHDILHHGTRQQVVKVLLDIFEAYPAKARFIKEQGLDAIDLAELSLGTHK
jgi:hypothetical protein